ncbi:MAG: hypothetical protein K6F81_05595 [Acholeplasmatales bacterium]|nr:hypothetical protein [Acholeplasmatales bacterium]
MNKKNILKILIILSFVGITILAFFLADQFSKNYKNEDSKNSVDFTENTTKGDTSQNTDSKPESSEAVIDSNTSSETTYDDELVSVQLQLIDKFGNVIFDEIRKAEENEVLYDILVKYHEVRAESSTYGKVIFDIDSVKTKFYQESYISILVNDKYSSFGVSSIYVYDGIKVTFKEVAL